MSNGPVYVLNPPLSTVGGIVIGANGSMSYRVPFASHVPDDIAPVCFIAGGNMNNAGARLRAYWPAQCIPGAAVVTWADTPPPARAYVFQKLVDLPLMERLRAGGAACFWDVCDPSWWFNPTEVREVLAHVTAVVASNEALADDMRQWCGNRVPVHCISDRVLLSHYDQQATHGDREPVRLIWFGAAQNRMALYAAHANLERLQANGYRVALTICDNAPNAPMDIEGAYPVYYTRWTLETEAATLAAHDVALLPPYPGAWGKVKSNNKALSAWAAGLPVTQGTDYDELRAMIADTTRRRNLAALGRRTVIVAYQTEQSAREWQELLAQYVPVAEVADGHS